MLIRNSCVYKIILNTVIVPTILIDGAMSGFVSSYHQDNLGPIR